MNHDQLVAKVAALIPKAKSLGYLLQQEPELLASFTQELNPTILRQILIRTVVARVTTQVPEANSNSQIGLCWLQTCVESQAFSCLWPWLRQPKHGLAYLAQGLNYIEAQSFSSKALGRCYSIPDLAQVSAELVAIEQLEPKETPEQLAALLARYADATLIAALPYIKVAQTAVFQSLGWHELLPLHQALMQQRRLESVPKIELNQSSALKLTERQFWLDLLQPIAPEHLSPYLRTMVDSKRRPHSLVVLHALLDQQRAGLEKKLVRHAQVPIQIYGLYPVRNPEDLRQRYLKFRAMHNEARQYGSERQHNTQRAVAVGLDNLAISAGFADATRLEWAMEADISQQAIPLNQTYSEQDWQLSLVLIGYQPKIQIHKQGKLLKSVPTKVKTSPIYQQMHDSVAQYKTQLRRFRDYLERAMCAGDEFSWAELQGLSQLAMMHVLVADLVWLTASGQFAWLDLSQPSLIGWDGQPLAVVGNVRIAHVYHLAQAGCLAQWQQQLVAQKRVQAFKQLFRELYLPTPAELERVDSSLRFAGRPVSGPVVSRLLQSRGWSESGDEDWVEAYKDYPSVTAVLTFTEAYHYLAGNERLDLDEVVFVTEDSRQNLAEVDPLIFSETMRDVDLLASVAPLEQQAGSNEMRLCRTALINALITDLSLTGVQCDGHFVLVQGQLARYRIHLLSGLIHIQSGNYLCIVPQHSASETLYLPFAEVDQRLEEIISKMFLLLADDQIKDESILSQIRSAVL